MNFERGQDPKHTMDIGKIHSDRVEVAKINWGVAPDFWTTVEILDFFHYRGFPIVLTKSRYIQYMGDKTPYYAMSVIKVKNNLWFPGSPSFDNKNIRSDWQKTGNMANSIVKRKITLLIKKHKTRLLK